MNRIFLTGDTHGDFTRFSTKNFPEQKELDKTDYVIILGDFGGIFGATKEEQYWLDWLEDKPFSLLFLDGNHENFDRLNNFLISNWNGGEVHEIRPGILHLMRGQVFDIYGKTFFTMGGARSHDIQDGILDPYAADFKEQYRRLSKRNAYFRVDHVSWWKEELPSPEEYKEARAVLEKNNWSVDYVLSHCTASNLQVKIDPHWNTFDPLTDFLREVQVYCEYKQWYFGHYHLNQMIDEKHQVLYEKIIEL